MNKFQKLARLNRDIELLENAGKIKAAEVLHQKFIKEAQFMPMTMAYNPYMVNPMMYSMMPRPVVNPATIPVAQPRTTPVQTTGQTPGVTVPPPTAVKPSTTPTNQSAPVGTPVSYNETPSKPVDMGVPSPPKPSGTYDNYYKDPRTGKTIFVDPGTGEDIPGQDGGYNVSPPGNSGNNSFNDPMDDPRVKNYWDKIRDNGFLSGKQKEQMLDQFMRSIGLK